MWALSRNIDLVFNVFFCIPLLYTMYRMSPTYILSWWMLSSLSSQIDNDPSSLWGAADMLAVQWIVKFLHLSSHKNKVICCSASQKLLSFPVFTYRVLFTLVHFSSCVSGFCQVLKTMLNCSVRLEFRQTSSSNTLNEKKNILVGYCPIHPSHDCNCIYLYPKSKSRIGM